MNHFMCVQSIPYVPNIPPVSSLTKELMSTRESREQEVAELRKSVEDVRASRQAELDKRVSYVQMSCTGYKFPRRVSRLDDVDRI